MPTICGEDVHSPAGFSRLLALISLLFLVVVAVLPVAGPTKKADCECSKEECCREDESESDCTKDQCLCQTASYIDSPTEKFCKDKETVPTVGTLVAFAACCFFGFGSFIACALVGCYSFLSRGRRLEPTQGPVPVVIVPSGHPHGLSAEMTRT